MFISIEGPEGGGKSTQIRWLAAWLEGRGHRTLIVREPGGTVLGERIRELLLAERASGSALSQLLLFSAARSELVGRVIHPALADGVTVLCDRYVDSTLAYQGYGDGVPLEQVRAISGIATGGLLPELTLLLDVDPAIGLARRREAGGWNSMDERPIAFHRAVRSGFLELAALEPGRWRVLDAGRPAEAVRTALERLLVESGL